MDRELELYKKDIAKLREDVESWYRMFYANLPPALIEKATALNNEYISLMGRLAGRYFMKDVEETELKKEFEDFMNEIGKDTLDILLILSKLATTEYPLKIPASPSQE